MKLYAMTSGQEHINAFKTFAGNLVVRYSNDVISEAVNTDSRRKLHFLEKAMYRMENELNGKVADIIAVAEEDPAINENQLERKLKEIFSSSIRELLRINFRG